MAKLDRAFYNRDTRAVAQDLLGRYLVHVHQGMLHVCRITETEAYIGRLDKASHAYNYSLTPRTKIMFGPPGFSYIYLIYGMYHCLNFVTEGEGEPCAVLVRGGAPRSNLDLLARSRYGCSMAELRPVQKKHLMDGPGKLCLAMALTRRENGLDLTEDTLFVCDALEDIGLAPHEEDRLPFTVKTGKRIGIDYAEEAVHFPWRYYI